MAEGKLRLEDLLGSSMLKYSHKIHSLIIKILIKKVVFIF